VEYPFKGKKQESTFKVVNLFKCISIGRNFRADSWSLLMAFAQRKDYNLECEPCALNTVDSTTPQFPVFNLLRC